MLGKSYGGYLSAIVTRKEKIDYLILSQPALYPDEGYEIPTEHLISQNPDIFRPVTQTAEDNKALSAYKQFKGPVLFIESENDEEVPSQTTRLYLKIEKLGMDNVVLQGADRTLSKLEWRRVFYKTVLSWLLKRKN